MHFEIDFSAAHLIRSLAAVRQVISSEELLRSMGGSLVDVHVRRHEQALAPDGTRWKELSPTTRKKKRKLRILYEHGDLLRFQYQVEGNTVRIGTNDWKGIFHHFGTRRTVRHPGLPARPLAGFPASDQQIVADLVADHLTAALR
ncbi:MAG: phage virion morphogenesis protein [Azonexus sp.]|jgi:phage virion morphogenesis protein|nr:phage virion morphogenesis protein [Azonexus sp.]